MKKLRSCTQGASATSEPDTEDLISWFLGFVTRRSTLTLASVISEMNLTKENNWANLKGFLNSGNVTAPWNFSNRKKYYVIGLYCSIIVWVILRHAFSIILFDSRLELAKSRNCMRFGRWKWRSNHYFKSLKLDSVENRHRGTQKVLILPHSLPLSVVSLSSHLSALMTNSPGPAPDAWLEAHKGNCFS